MLDEQLVHAPDFPAHADWLNSPPVSLHKLRQGASHPRIALVDFWDYTCINCLRTLPYVAEWDAKYRDVGLATIGVHAPEFSFAREARHVARAIAELGIQYPVVLDNDYETWEAFNNKGWPSKFIVDADGYLRYQHLGEGEYLATELAIQALLREANPAFRPPPLTIPKRAEDAPGTLCHRPTPELYCGYERSSLGNAEGVEPDAVLFYADPGSHELNQFYLRGAWRTHQEYCALAGASGQIALRYKAKDVNIVMAPQSQRMEERAQVTVCQDGQWLTPAHAGADVTWRDGEPVVIPEWPRMVQVVSNPDFEEHELLLDVQGQGCAFYAFTFTPCIARDPRE